MVCLSVNKIAEKVVDANVYVVYREQKKTKKKKESDKKDKDEKKGNDDAEAKERYKDAAQEAHPRETSGYTCYMFHCVIFIVVANNN